MSLLYLRNVGIVLSKETVKLEALTQRFHQGEGNVLFKYTALIQKLNTMLRVSSKSEFGVVGPRIKKMTK